MKLFFNMSINVIKLLLTMNFILRAEPEEMSVTKGATCNFRTKRTARVKLVIFIIVRTHKCRIHKSAELIMILIFF